MTLTPEGRTATATPARRGGRWRTDERGAISLSLPVFAMVVVMVGAILFRVGFAADLRAGTQTGADAAALAAAQAVGEEILAFLAEAVEEFDPDDPDAEPIPLDPEVLCELVGDGAATAAAEEFAGANDTNVTGFERDCMEVSVSVASNGGVPGVADLSEETPPADANAAAVVEIPDLPGEGADIADIAEFLEAGVELDVRLVE